MKTIIKVIISLLLIWGVLCAVRPYWHRNGLEKELKAASIYGTKNSVEATRKFLDRKMKERGYDFTGKDFFIEKDERNNVTISIIYKDEVRIFDMTLKKLEFKVEETSSEVKDFY